REGDFFGLVAGAANAAALAVVAGECTAVVVAELDDDEIALLCFLEDRIPAPLGNEGAAGSSADGAVDDVDSAGVEELAQRVAPAALAGGVDANGGVANEEK